MITPWYFNGLPVLSIADCPETAIGFIYKITDPNGKCYWGKKILCNTSKVRISKREKSATGTRKTFKIVKKESDWLKYWGSCKDPGYTDLRATCCWHREILEFCCTKKMMSYKELVHQINNNVLEADTWNGNLMSRIFKKDIVYCQ